MNSRNLLIKTKWNEIVLIRKSTSENKRGKCFNFLPFSISGNAFDKLVEYANEKLSPKFKELVESEFKFLALDRDGKLSDLKQFKSNHPFWKKEDELLLKSYYELYNNFVKRFNREKNKSSKNIFSVNDETCLSSIQFHEHMLIVNQRSCDMSCGFLADAWTIHLFAKLTNAVDVLWLVNVPHVYENNWDETVKYYGEFENKNRKFKFNVR